MKYEIENQEYPVIITRKNNKNTYIRIKDDFTIYVTTNYLITNHQIKKLLDQNYEYLKKNMIKTLEKQQQLEKFYYQGIPYNIIIMDVKGVQLIGNNIYVKNKDTLEKWVKKQIKEIFQAHLNSIYPKFEENIPYPNLRIRKMKTRWGVCNKVSKTITLNSDLIRYSFDKLDYVIVHELSHFIHFNHSTSFWSLVQKYCPNYKKIRKEMRD